MGRSEVWYAEAFRGGRQSRRSLGVSDLQEYQAWYAKNRRSGERAGFALRPFVESLGEKVDVQAVTREHLQRYVDGRVDGRSSLTVRGDFARARAFLRWIAARKDIPVLSQNSAACSCGRPGVDPQEAARPVSAACRAGARRGLNGEGLCWLDQAMRDYYLKFPC